MRKIYLNIAFFAASICTINAQVVPNSSFETWSQNGPFETPSNWNVSPAASKSTDAHTGTYSLQLKTGIFTNPQTQTIDTIPGMAVTGQQGMGPGNQGANGYPFASRPDSLFFWYKYQAQNNDSFVVRINLTKWNSNARDVISDLIFKAAASSKYTRVAIAIPYLLNSVPDSASIQILSSLSPRENLILGSTLLIDDIGFVSNNSSIEQDISNSNPRILIYPNPCANTLRLSDFISDYIKVIDIYGAVVFEQNTQGKDSFELSTMSFAPGIYFIVLNDGVFHKIIKE
jgi:hypothetical protein